MPAMRPSDDGNRRRDMNNDTWTVARVLDWTTSYFQDKGFESARLDAELLISDALKIDRVGIYLQHHKPLQPTELAEIRERVRRRAQHEPVAYITGSRGFWEHEFQVDPRVLVPRPETEHLVEAAVAYLSGLDAPRVIDVGSGSGCIAISVACAVPTATVVGVDLSPEALELAQQNARALGADTVQWVQGDLLEGIEGSFQLILSNPPYIPSADLAELMPSVRDFEPHLALDGGADGLELYRRLVPQAFERLVPGGALMVEIGHDQGEAVSSLFEENGFTEVTLGKDYAALDRWISGRRT